jgi:hypothetical protein
LDPLIVFLIAGTFSMSGAICAGRLVKLSDEEKPAWIQTQRWGLAILLGGNLLGLVLVAAMIYGIKHLHWWVPVGCLFITFPVLHVVIIERVLGAVNGFFTGAAASLVSILLLWLYW